MIPVTQTEFGAVRGNCLMAALASILELPIEAMPVMDDVLDARGWGVSGWWRVFVEICHCYWLHPVVVSNGDPMLAPPGYHIGSGISPRGLSHAVVVKDGEMVHDPHPSRDGVDKIEMIYVLTPLLVAK